MTFFGSQTSVFKKREDELSCMGTILATSQIPRLGVVLMVG
jgi:hypothetical protein